METVPAAPDENSSTSGRRNILKSEEGGSRQEGGRSSPPPNCAICLGRCRNKSFTDSCLHQFCFKCLVTWSKVKTECPLCKQTFKSIIHNVKSNHQYEEYQVEQPAPEDNILDRINLRGIVAATRRYRFRATLTMPRVDSVAFHRFLMSYPPISTIVRGGFPSDLGSHRRSRISPTAFRRTIYRHNLWARPLPDFTGRFRDCTPDFYRYNDSQIHRLIPWLNRELHYLLNDNSSHIAYVLPRIVELLPVYHITSPEFREAMERYFGDRTEHFLHELYCFASTPYDLTGYDRNIQYTSDPHSEVNQVISGSDSDDSVDSDIVMVSSSHPSEGGSAPVPSTSTATAGPSRPASSRPAPTFLPHSADRDPSVIPIETISHSDTDDDSSEVMVVGYIKPPHQRTPEVVDLLASDSDVVLQETMPEPTPSSSVAVDLTSAPVTIPAPAPAPAPALSLAPAPAPAPIPRLDNLVKLKLTRPRPPPPDSDSDSDETYTPSPPPPPARRRRRPRPKPKKTSRTSRTDRKKSDDGPSGNKTDKRTTKNGRIESRAKRATPDFKRSEESSSEATTTGPSRNNTEKTRSKNGRNVKSNARRALPDFELTEESSDETAIRPSGNKTKKRKSKNDRNVKSSARQAAPNVELTEESSSESATEPSGVKTENRKSKNGRNVKSIASRATADDEVPAESSSEPAAGPSGVSAPTAAFTPASASTSAPLTRKRSNSSRGESPERKRLKSVVVKSTSSPQSRYYLPRSRSSSSVSSANEAGRGGGARRPRVAPRSRAAPRARAAPRPASTSDSSSDSTSDSEDDIPLKLTIQRLRNLLE